MQRRNFLIWLSISLISFIGFSIHFLNKLLKYIAGPKLTIEQEAKLIQSRIRDLERNVNLEKLRAERLSKTKIFICEIKDLRKKEGLSFVDFNLKPALALLDTNGKPILISSVCTHLGCTVQNKLNKGRLLCPCHITYFDLASGRVLEGPAKTPLPMIPFVVENEKIFIVKHV